jgi:prevent-host-death family protein
MKHGQIKATGGTRREIGAGEFKARCLELMNEVHDRHVSLVITKRGRPVAQLVPVEPRPKLGFGCMRGTVRIVGDIVASTGERWDAEA